MRGSSEVVGFGHGDGNSFDLGKTSHDLDEKHTIKQTICSGINTSALITRKNAINRVIAEKRCWNTVGNELGLYACVQQP